MELMTSLLGADGSGRPDVPGEEPPRRLPSGTKLVLAGAVLMAVVVLVIVFVSPAVEQELMSLGAELEQDVLASDLLSSGDAFVLAAEGDRDRACLTLDIADEERDSLCASGAIDGLGPIATTPAPDDAVWFLSGTSAEGAAVIRLTLDGGEERVLRPIDAPAGYPASFYATILGPDRRVTEVQLVDRDERVVASLRCDGAVATADGPGEGCTTSG